VSGARGRTPGRAREQEERATCLLARNQALEQALDAAGARLRAEIRDREQARADP
jgi:hypothetical protein